MQTDDDLMPGETFQTDLEAARRNSICPKDGKFASGEFYLVACDLLSSEEEDAKKELLFMNGENIFNKTTSFRLADFELKKSLTEAVNSARGYASRYCRTKHAWRDRNTVRKYKPYSRNEDLPVRTEVGGYVPVRVKVVAIPPDTDADRCSSWEEYEMLYQSRGKKPEMSRRDFEIYKD